MVEGTKEIWSNLLSQFEETKETEQVKKRMKQGRSLEKAAMPDEEPKYSGQIL